MSQVNNFSNHRLVNWFKLSSPSTFYPVAGKLIPLFWALTFLFGAAGLWVSFFVAPVDAVQGHAIALSLFMYPPHGCQCSSI